MEDLLADAVVVVRDFIGGGSSVDSVLTRLAELTVRAVEADMAGLTLSDGGGRPTTAVFTDELVNVIDQAQYESGDGPCLQAFRTGGVFRVDDTAAEQRWPAFAQSAFAHGVHSSLSVPVVVADQPIGALNIYGRRPGQFVDDGIERTGMVFAGQVAIAARYWDVAGRAEGLSRALESRAVIEQAKGVIMATTGCGPDEAFRILREQSQSENRKIRDLAAELVERQLRRSGE
jgi:transcriptional regulator with GAF, ATPase, and Fis domain